MTSAFKEVDVGMRNNYFNFPRHPGSLTVKYALAKRNHGVILSSVLSSYYLTQKFNMSLALMVR